MDGHIRKRGNKFQVCVYVGKVAGKRKYKYETFDTEKQAQKYRTKLLHQMDENTYVDSGKLTLGDYLERWLEDYCKAKLAPKTFIRYEQIIKLHVIPHLGKVMLSRLQPLDLQGYYTKALTKGRIGKKHKDKKGLSPTTVLFHHKVIHKALEQAVKWQLTGRNIADAVEPPQKDTVEYRLIDTETLTKIIDVMKEKCPVLILPVLVAAATGMRRGEVLGLKWSDFNPTTKRLAVKQQLQRIEGELTLRPVKTNRSKRPVPLSDHVVDMLKTNKAAQNEISLAKGKKHNPLDLIFCWQDTGLPIDPDYMTKRFIKFAEKLVPGVRLHDLRHSFATMLLEKNVNLKKVSSVLGHSSIGITGDIYSHITGVMEDEIAEIVQNEFKNLDCQGIVKEKKKSSRKTAKAL